MYSSTVVITEKYSLTNTVFNIRLTVVMYVTGIYKYNSVKYINKRCLKLCPHLLFILLTFDSQDQFDP